MRHSVIALGAFWMVVSSAALASAAIKPAERHDAGGSKTGRYATDGFFAGGERTVTAAKLKDVRRAKSNQGFERIVLDLESEAEDPDSLPYFQLQSSPHEGRFVLSIWANVQYEFDVARVQKAFQKSAVVKRLNVLPRLEDGLTIIEFVLHPQASGKELKYEVFRLGRPARIILDVL